jgi:LexA-binding, inner membrane-associated putative hydrolase
MPLDIGVGILLSLFVAHTFGFHATLFFLLIGIFFILLPDIDIIPIFQHTDYDHRSITHYPALYILLALLVYFSAGPVYAMLFVVCIVAHFLHDTIGIGWGIAWAWPFSNRKFLFPEKGRRQEYGFFMTWFPHEEEVMAKRWHDPHWAYTYYLRPNPIAYVEYSVLLLSILVLFVYFR